MKKFMMFCSTSLLTLSVSTNALAVRTTDMYDLTQIYQLALDSDPVFKSANDQRLASEQAIPTAVAGFLPFVEGQITQLNQMIDNGFLYEPSPIESEFGILIYGTEVVRTAEYNGQVTQTLFDLSKWHTLRQAYRIKDTAEANYLNAAQDLMVRSATSYFNVLRAIDNLNFVIAEKKAVQRQLEQTQAKFQVGLVAITDVKELEAQRDAIRAQEISAYNQIQSAREAVRVITGIFPEKLAALRERIPLISPAPTDGDSWAGIAEDSNPKLQAAKYNSEVQKQSVNIARDQRLPTISFTGETFKQRYGTLSDPTSSDSEWQWNALLTGEVTLFSGGAITSSIRKAQYTYQQSLDDLEKVRRDTVSSTENAYRDVETALTRVKALQKAVISSQVALDATIAGYNVGTRTSVDVLTEISNLYQQQRDLSNARYDYILAILALKKAAGIIIANDIFVVNNLLVNKPATITDEKAERAEILKFANEPTPSGSEVSTEMRDINRLIPMEPKTK